MLSVYTEYYHILTSLVQTFENHYVHLTNRCRVHNYIIYNLIVFYVTT